VTRTRTRISARLAASLTTLLLAVGALWFATAPTARAHALLVSSSPAAGSSLTRLPAAVSVTFSEAVVPRLSSLRVYDSSGRQVGRQPTRAASGSTLTLSVPLPPLLGGVYTVRWKSVSSDDGHAASGSFTFGVGPLAYAAMSGPAPELLSAPSAASAPVVAGTWIFDAGLGLLVGGCWIAAFGFPGGTRRPLILALSGAGALATGLVVIGWAQAAADGIGPGELASTSLGIGLLVQLIPGIAAAACIASALALPAHGRVRRGLLIAALAFAAASTAGHVLTTHAASGSHAYAELALEWLHVAAFATWIGGLAALLLTLGAREVEGKSAAVRKFSRVAGYSLAVLCLSGVLRGLAEVAAWHALATTLFGRLVVLKIALLGVLAALGAYNRYRAVPAVAEGPRAPRMLRRVGSVELGVASVALLAAALLSSSLPPALAQATPTPSPAPHVLVSGTANGVRAGLDVTPDYVGPNRFTLRLYDATSGRELPSAETTSAKLVLTPAATAQSRAAATVILTSSADGSYTAVGDDQLSAIGSWAVTADIEVSGRAVAVPLALTCVPSPAQLEEMTMGRMSMAYGIQLPDGRQLAAYFSPGRAGLNAVHLAITDQRSAPISISGVPTLTFHQVAATGSPPPSRTLTLRPLGPNALAHGQYLGTAVLGAGRWTFHVTAIDSTGHVLSADFVLSVS
jgi:copper transport protein